MRARVRDWRDPDYAAIYEERSERLRTLRGLNAEQRAKVHDHYAHNPIDWIEDWAHTWDPRRLEAGLPALRPFLLFPRQRELIEFWHGCNIDRSDGVVEKSRELGVSWCAVAYAVWMWIYRPGAVIGFGSYEASKVDVLGVTDSLLEKARVIIRHLPPEMQPTGFNSGSHLLHKRLLNPANGAQINGEVGDNIGRGSKASIYFVDEYAFLKHHEMIDGALSNTSDCKQYISTAYGMGAFFAKTQNPTFRQFRFEWRQDPRKSEDWYAAFLKKWGPTITAREVDIDHASSIENVVIEARYVEAARQVKRLLLAKPEITVLPRDHYTRGIAGLDVGGGVAPSVFIPRHGPYIGQPKSWTDQHGDTTITGQRALRYARNARTQQLNFDAPAVGAGVASTLRHSKPEERALAPIPSAEPEVPQADETKEERITRELYDAFGNDEEDHVVVIPGAKDREVVTARGVNTGEGATDWVRWPDGRTSKESFANLRAEIWWIMRDRFQKTYETWLALTGDPEGTMHPSSELIFLPDCDQLVKELAVLTWHEKPGGKIGIESKKDLAARGVASPDFADALALTYVPARPTARNQKLKGYF